MSHKSTLALVTVGALGLAMIAPATGSARGTFELAFVCHRRVGRYWVRSGLMASSSKARCWIGVGLV
jgi:hypothetical protein